jgi:hypothetical protein
MALPVGRKRGRDAAMPCPALRAFRGFRAAGYGTATCGAQRAGGGVGARCGAPARWWRPGSDGAPAGGGAWAVVAPGPVVAPWPGVTRRGEAAACARKGRYTSAQLRQPMADVVAFGTVLVSNRATAAPASLRRCALWHRYGAKVHTDRGGLDHVRSLHPPRRRRSALARPGLAPGQSSAAPRPRSAPSAAWRPAHHPITHPARPSCRRAAPTHPDVIF